MEYSWKLGELKNNFISGRFVSENFILRESKNDEVIMILIRIITLVDFILKPCEYLTKNFQELTF